MFAFVDVLLVIVPLVALMFVKDKLPAERVVIVAFVIVAFVPTKLEVFVIDALDVVA
jgi:hypothetical protein